MYQHYTQMALWLALFFSVIGIGPAAAGTLTGSLTGAPGQSQLSEAIVWAEPIGSAPAFAPPTQHAVMAQANLAFIPRVLPVLVGTTVDFPNQDTMFHSVYSFSRQQRFEIGLYKPGESRSVTFQKVGAIKLFCNIHDNMFGTVLVLPTPYFSTVKADGGFTISDVPAGNYTVQVWHEQLQGEPQSVSVPAEGMADLSFVLNPKRQRKRSTE